MALPVSQSIKRWIRVARFAVHLARGATIAALLFPLQSTERRKREVEHWSLQLLDLFNVRLFLHGSPPPYGARPYLIVSNHVSWLDIFAINAVVPARFVSKSEVRAWPVIGWLSARAGTLFIHRARRHDTARVNHHAAAALRRGDVLAVFPEGTTTDGSMLLKFHASLFEPALEAEALVQPVAIRYERDNGTLCTEAAYHGGMSIWDSLMGITSLHEIHAHVCFLPPIAPERRHRRDIALEAQAAVERTLFPRANHSRTETRADLPVEVQ